MDLPLTHGRSRFVVRASTEMGRLLNHVDGYSGKRPEHAADPAYVGHFDETGSLGGYLLAELFHTSLVSSVRDGPSVFGDIPTMHKGLSRQETPGTAWQDAAPVQWSTGHGISTGSAPLTVWTAKASRDLHWIGRSSMG